MFSLLMQLHEETRDLASLLSSLLLKLVWILCTVQYTSRDVFQGFRFVQQSVGSASPPELSLVVVRTCKVRLAIVWGASILASWRSMSDLHCLLSSSTVCAVRHCHSPHHGLDLHLPTPRPTISIGESVKC